jgi:Probable cobalt transporter subunit (CbtB)
MNQLSTSGIPAALPLDRIRLALLALAGLAVLYAVLFDQGTVTLSQNLFHEVFHDARHLLGIPCH